MNKDEEIALFDELDRCLRKLEEIYKFNNLIKKFCDLNKDSDDLYEISSVINIATAKIDTLSHELYRIIHQNDIPPILENLNKTK